MKRVEQFEVDAAGQSIGSVLTALETEEQQVQVFSSADAAEIVSHLAEGYRRVGRFDQAHKTYRRGLRLWQRLRRENRICWCLWGIGSTYRVAGEFQNALRWFRAAADLARSCGERHCNLWSHAEIAETMRILGFRQTSYCDHSKLLAEFRQFNDIKGICWALSGMGQILRMECHYREARQMFLTTLIEAQGAYDRVNAGYAFRGLAEVAKEMGDYGIAEQFARLAIANFEEKGYSTGQAYAQKTLADIVSRGGSPEIGLGIAAEALSIFTRIGKRRGIAFALQTYADIQRMVGTGAQALKSSCEASTIFRSINVGNLSVFDPAILRRHLHTSRHSHSPYS